MDQQAYLKRINYTGDLQPTLSTLQALQKTHLYNVPFENLDIHYGHPIILDIEQTFDKLVTRNRGGFCYELNGLFHELLKSLGFSVKRISARVFGASKVYGPEFDHLAVIVHLDGEDYLADVGFGDFSFVPLKIKLGEVQSDGYKHFVMDHYTDGSFRILQLKEDENIPQYLFTAIERDFSEFDAMCHVQQTAPDSFFTQKRRITIPIPAGRVTLSGYELKITENGTSREVLLENEMEFDQALWDYFRVKI